MPFTNILELSAYI